MGASRHGRRMAHPPFRLAGAPLLTLALTLAATAACSGPTLVQEPGDGGGFGVDGAFGVFQLSEPMRVRGDRSVAVDIFVPTADGDRFSAEGPPVVLVAGGAVPAERYHWLAQHLASRGAVVVAPRFLFDLAFFNQADVPDSLSALRRRSEDPNDLLAGTVAEVPAMAIGHSLGGVVAATAFEQSRDFGSLVLLASYPDPSATPTRRDGLALSILGADDGLVDPKEVEDGLAALRAPSTGALVDGLTHFQFTDDATDGEIDKEGTTSPLDVDEARGPALFLMDAFLDATTPGTNDDDLDGAAVLNDDATWPARAHRLVASDADADAGADADADADADGSTP